MRTGRTFVALLVIALALAGPAATSAVALETPPPTAPRFADLPADDVLAHLALAEHLRRGQAAANAARDVLGGPAPSAFDDPDLDAHLAATLTPLGPGIPPEKIPRSNRDPAALADLHDALLAHARRRAGDLALDGSRDEHLWTSSVSALWTASGRPATPEDHATLTEQGRLMPAAEQRTVAPLVEAMTQAAWLVRAATRDVPGPVLTLFARVLDAGPETEATPRSQTVSDATSALHDRYVHQANLFASARLATAAALAAEDALAARRATLAAGWHDASHGPLIDPLGTVAVGTFGDDDYSALGANRTYLTVDPAGNDTYTNVNLGGGAFVLTSISVPPCWVANLCVLAAPVPDHYRSSIASLWLDAAGNDTIRCKTIPNAYVSACLGSSVALSVGIAVRGKNERAVMNSSVIAMGAADMGSIGLHAALGDREDEYNVKLGAPGAIAYSWQASVGIILDRGGDDHYHAGSLSHSAQNGVTLLRDDHGEDEYYLGNVGFGYGRSISHAEFLDLGGSLDSYSGRFPANVIASNDASWEQWYGRGQDQ